MLAALLVLAALLGLVIGSFLNVVIYRVPAGRSIVRPASRCPDCDASIRARHNIPVAGWLILRGRCADCGAPISPRYPLVELGTGVLFVLVTLWLWRRAQLPLAPALLYFAAVGVALAMIDLDVRRLPNAIVLPSYPVLAVLLALASALSADWSALGRAGIGAAALLGFYLLLVLVYPAGMGWGDVKLSGLVGAILGYVGWSALVVGAFAGFFLGALVAVIAMMVGRAGRKTALPFGPFMLLGAAVGAVLGSRLGEIYLGALGA